MTDHDDIIDGLVKEQILLTGENEQLLHIVEKLKRRDECSSKKIQALEDLGRTSAYAMRLLLKCLIFVSILIFLSLACWWSSSHINPHIIVHDELSPTIFPGELHPNPLDNLHNCQQVSSLPSHFGSTMWRGNIEAALGCTYVCNLSLPQGEASQLHIVHLSSSFDNIYGAVIPGNWERNLKANFISRSSVERSGFIISKHGESQGATFFPVTAFTAVTAYVVENSTDKFYNIFMSPSNTVYPELSITKFELNHIVDSIIADDDTNAVLLFGDDQFTVALSAADDHEPIAMHTKEVFLGTGFTPASTSFRSGLLCLISKLDEIRMLSVLTAGRIDVKTLFATAVDDTVFTSCTIVDTADGSRITAFGEPLEMEGVRVVTGTMSRHLSTFRVNNIVYALPTAETSVLLATHELVLAVSPSHTNGSDVSLASISHFFAGNPLKRTQLSHDYPPYPPDLGCASLLVSAKGRQSIAFFPSSSGCAERRLDGHFTVTEWELL